MSNAQFNIKLINILKDILLRLHDGGLPESDQMDFKAHFKHVSAVEILLIIQELKSGDHGITSEDVMKFFSVYNDIFGQSIDFHVPESHHPGHPAQVLKDENKAFQSILIQISKCFELIENNQEDMIERLKEQMSLLGQFYNHYNRKEKLFFPILERYGYYTSARIMWGDNDRIRTLYKGTKRMMENLPDIEFKYVKKSYGVFESNFKEMMFQEEIFLLPIVQSLFNEDDWLAIEEESDAFGYCFDEPEEKWGPARDLFMEDEGRDIDSAANVDTLPEHLAFGGGYLTLKEADHILNNLPLELTFVDKNGIFKYFNDKIASSEMMFVRTPISIGRNVANCHPPKSMKKVMRLIRDLKTRKRTSESMWFRKKDQYIHITYKGVFEDRKSVV